MIDHHEVRALLQRGVEAGLVLPPQVGAEQRYALPHFASRPRPLNPAPNSGIHSLSIGASEWDRRTLHMTVGTFEPLQNQVFLGGWEQQGKARAAVILIEKKHFIPQDERGGSEGDFYKGVAHLGRANLKSVGVQRFISGDSSVELPVTSLDVYYPCGPLTEEMMEDPTVLRLFAQASIYSSRTRRYKADWKGFANLPDTPDAVRAAILSPGSAR